MIRYGWFTLLILPLLAGLLPAQVIPVVLHNSTSFRSQNTDIQAVALPGNEYIVAWRSARPGSAISLVYAQKVNAKGEMQWEAGGVPVCPSLSSQNYFQVAQDGYGGAVFVWEDLRDNPDEPELWMQRINGKGEPLWGPDGIRLSESPGAQRNPRIFFDSWNTFFVAWEDFRKGSEEPDIYLQNINLASRINWKPDGIPVCAAPGPQKDPVLLSDGGEGVIVMWEDFRSTNYWNLYAQKIDKKGFISWRPDGHDLFPGVQENQSHPAATDDGAGGFFFVYEKYNDASKGYDLYRARVNEWGEMMYHYSTCHSIEDQLSPAVSRRGDQVAIAWEDYRYKNWDIYLQLVRLDDGKLVWEQNGKSVTRRPGEDRAPRIIADAQLDCQFVAWTSTEGDRSGICVQRIGKDAEPEWNEEENFSRSDAHADVVMLPDGEGGLSLFWEDEREAETVSPWMQRVSFSGKSILGAEGKKLSGSHDSFSAGMKDLKILPSVNGDFFLAWSDERNGKDNGDIFIQKFNSEGESLWKLGGIPACAAEGEQSRPLMVEDGAGGVIVIWADRRNRTDDDIFAQRISAEGQILWEVNGVKVVAAPRSQSQIQAVSDGKEGVVIAWVDAREMSSAGFDIYLQRINHEGSAIWGESGKALVNAAGNQTSPSLSSDGKGGAFITWMDARSGYANVYLQHVGSNGLSDWMSGGIGLHTGSHHQRSPRLSVDEKRNLVICWEDARLGDKQEKIWTDLISPLGARLWGEQGKQVSAQSGKQYEPRLLTDELGNTCIAWLLDVGNEPGSTRLYVQKWDADGRSRWGAFGNEVVSGLNEYNEYQMSRDAEGNLWFFWSRRVEGVSRVFYQKLNDAGTALFPFTGKLADESPGEQLYPVMAVNPNGRVIVFWVEKDGSGDFSLKGSLLRNQP